MMKITGVDYENGSVVGVDVEGVDGRMHLIPVVHGHWEMDNHSKLICSKCKIPSAMARQFIGMQYKSRYCPNCGAEMYEMDGERDEAQ